MKTMVRSILSICLAVVLLFSCMCLNGLALSPVEPTYTWGEFSYRLSMGGDYAIITGITPKSQTVTVPAYFDKLPVGAISIYSPMEGNFSKFLVEPENKFFKAHKGVLYDASGEILIKVPSQYKGKLEILPSVTTIEESAAISCKGITEVVFPKGLKTIGLCAFASCIGLRNLSLPEGLELIHSEAFYQCSNLATITMGDKTRVSAKVFHQTAFWNNSANWENGVLYLGETLLSAQKLTASSYTVKKGTVSIGYGAFEDITSLTEIIIPNSVKEIGELAFWDCINLKKVVIPENGCVATSGSFENVPPAPAETIYPRDGLFYYGTILVKSEEERNGRKTFNIPPGTTVVADGAFLSGDFKYEEIWIPASLRHFPFEGLSDTMQTYTVEKGNPYFTAIDGVLYNKEVTTLLRCPQGKTSVTIPESVTAIAPNAFAYCHQLKEVVLPKGLKTIGERAFYDCDLLEKVNIPNGVANLDLALAFGECSRLREVTLPNTLTRLTAPNYSCFRINFTQIPYGVKYIAPTYLRIENPLQVYSNSFALQFAKQYGVKYKITKEGPKPVTSRVEKPIASSPASSEAVSPKNETVSSVVEPSAPQQGSTEQTTKVETPTNIPETPTNATQPKQFTPPWIWIACGGGVVLLGGSALWLWRKKKNK